MFNFKIVEMTKHNIGMLHVNKDSDLQLLTPFTQNTY